MAYLEQLDDAESPTLQRRMGTALVKAGGFIASEAFDPQHPAKSEKRRMLAFSCAQDPSPHAKTFLRLALGNGAVAVTTDADLDNVAATYWDAVAGVLGND